VRGRFASTGPGRPGLAKEARRLRLSLPAEDLEHLEERTADELAFLNWDDAGRSGSGCRSVLGAQGKTVGFLVLASDFDSLREELAQHSPADRVHVTSGGRVVFAHPEPFEGERALEPVPEEGSLTDYRDASGARILAAARSIEAFEGVPMVLVVANEERRLAA
jgi:hypothetical protein